jgi:STE24 endopeptidase
LKRRSVRRWLFFGALVVVVLSPLLYWSSGIGQMGAGLSAEVGRAPDGTLVSSPKAEMLHRLSLPLRIERLLVYPVLLICLQLSGQPVALRRWLEDKVWGQTSRQARGLPGGATHSWRGYVSARDLFVFLPFALILEGALALFYLPLNFYSDFIVGHQFSLSTQTAANWASDWLKNTLIVLLTNGPIWAGFYTLMRLIPRWWPIPAGALMLLLSALFVLITPLVITPLFYEVQPLANPALRARILDLADGAGMHVDEVYIINASAKTTRVNAYFTGFGDARRIVLYDTLLTDYTSDQVEVVLAHEMAHWYYRHVLLAWLGAGAAGWIGLFGLRWLLNRTWQLLGLTGPADVAGLPYLMAVTAIAAILALPIHNGVARYGERQADHFSLVITQKPNTFIELFEQFAIQNLSVVDVPTWERLLFFTHPPIVDRIRMAETMRGD